MFNRLLTLQLPQGQSAFIWGARNTGKSTFLINRYPDAIYYDLLHTDQVTRLLMSPHLLREELAAVTPEALQHPVIIDEVQKVPALLDEVHWLIENKHIGFILCGSSARKLKRGQANLLGGRAWSFVFYPLVYKEIPGFSLLKALNQGLLPAHYLSDYPQRALRAYVTYYLKEEIQAEATVRNLASFARFLDSTGFSQGEQVNYTNVARDCGVSAKTVKEYYQILVDTLMGYLIYPFSKAAKRALIQSAPKFYLFDVGLANYISKTSIHTLKGAQAGKSFEHFILMEIKAFLGLHEIDSPVYYWRSKTGLEVDFILDEGAVAVEVKITDNPSLNELKGLSAFCDDYNPRQAIVVCQAPRKRLIKTKKGHTIEVFPWQDFLEALWNKKFSA